jgi:hypothetical protein
MMNLLKIKTLSLSIVFIGLIAVLTMYSCAKEKGKTPETEDTTNPIVNTPNCDTVTFTYNAKVKVIINNNCSGCHNSGSPNGYLLDYNSLKAKALSGALKGSLNGNGYPVMPPSGKLSNCDIKGIENWILNGSPNN